MSAIYRSVDSSKYEDNCPFCLESMKDSDVIAHSGEGDLHPIHRDCARLAAMINNLCPSCRIETETDFLKTRKDKCFSILKPLPKIICFGAAAGAFVALANVSALSQIESAALLSAAVAGCILAAIGDPLEPWEVNIITKTATWALSIGQFTAGKFVAGWVGTTIGTGAVVLAYTAGIRSARLANRIAWVAVREDAQVRTANIVVAATLIFMAVLSSKPTEAVH